MSDTAITDVDVVYQRTCGTGWPAPATAGSCELIDLQRNCIFADKGYVFSNAKWRDVFAKKSWYARRRDFKETDLSKVAVANVHQLKLDAMACRGGEIPPIPSKFDRAKISKADLKTIVKWFADRRRGKVFLPATLIEGGLTDEASFRQWTDSQQWLHLNPWTPIGYDTYFDPRKVEAPTPAATVRRVMVATGTPPPPKPGDNCDDESCDGFETISFDLDRAGKIIGLEIFAAACPLVYVEHSDGSLDYQGEILRNVVGANWERTQHLTIRDAVSAGQCPSNGEIRMQMVEAKDETTFLDDVVLEVDGVSIAPRSCDSGSTAAYCNDDGRYATMRQGDVVPLVFDLPAGATCGHIALRANGYYAPNVSILPLR